MRERTTADENLLGSFQDLLVDAFDDRPPLSARWNPRLCGRRKIGFFPRDSEHIFRAVPLGTLEERAHDVFDVLFEELGRIENFIPHGRSTAGSLETDAGTRLGDLAKMARDHARLTCNLGTDEPLLPKCLFD